MKTLRALTLALATVAGAGGRPETLLIGGESEASAPFDDRVWRWDGGPREPNVVVLCAHALRHSCGCDRHGGRGCWRGGSDDRSGGIRLVGADGLVVAPGEPGEVQARVAKGEQSLLFLNRRGYAPITLCRACGHQVGCDDCDARMVEHRFLKRLVCHQCGATKPVPVACPACGGAIAWRPAV